MTERENFLARWSRRKIEAEETPPQPAPGTDAASAPRPDAQPAAPVAKPEATAEFDIASLPSIESITAATDIRAFLAPGVPRDLMRAALRRAWAEDPAIRDFVGLQEYDWDFNNPTAVPGFGDLPPGTDVRQLLADVFGDRAKADESDPAPAAEETQAATIKKEELAHQPEPAGAQKTGDKPDELSRPELMEPAPDEFVQRNSNIALQDSIRERQPGPVKVARTHGRALPE
jgi:hypothetical protein